MTPDNVVSIAFLFAIFGAVLLKAAKDVLYEAHQLVADARILTQHAQKTAEDALKAGRQLEESERRLPRGSRPTSGGLWIARASG